MLVWRAPPAREVRALETQVQQQQHHSDTAATALQQTQRCNALAENTAETVRNGAVRLCAPLVTTAAGAVAAVQECAGGVVCARVSRVCMCVVAALDDTTVYEALRYATSVCGLKLLATRPCGLKLLVLV